MGFGKQAELLALAQFCEAIIEEWKEGIPEQEKTPAN
jgi:hypothetical protein